nr:pro-resilin-like [Penaeus vannamei]
MIAKTAVVLAFVAVAVAAPSQPAYGYAPEPAYEEPAKYDFNYAVKDDYSGNDFGHQEARDGYDTQGSYYVLLPDGRLQRVTYTVNGDSGYVAEVSYEGEASIRVQARPRLQANSNLRLICILSHRFSIYINKIS